MLAEACGRAPPAVVAGAAAARDLGEMSHSVRRHLRVEIDAYDRAIRAWIPGYEAMLARTAQEIAAVSPARVLELGAGTGGLSAALLGREEVGAVELLDVDPEMLEQARIRLAPFGDRARFRVGSFAEPLPSCDAAASSLALHHIETMPARVAIFRQVFEALPPGGLFVNADVMMPTSGPVRDASFAAWAAHMARSGISEEEARRHFAEWAEEDHYHSPEEELAGLAEAGFEAASVWRDDPSTILVARRP